MVQGIQNVTFSVTPDELRVKAEDVRNRNRKLAQMWEDNKSVFMGTAGYWNSEGADTFRNAVSTLDRILDDFFKKWEEVAVSLEKTAGVYDQGESLAETTASTLPTDIIR